jgi:carbamoyltransferase
MSIYILGISCYYHDASAALLKDGVIIAAAEEERFTRVKHDASFPINALTYCLERQNITIQDIAYIGYYEKPLLKFERVLSQHIEMFPLSCKTFLSSLPSWINQKLRAVRTIKKNLLYTGNIFFIEHHLAHAASAFLVSPFKEASIVTVDGVGEWTTTAYGIGEGNSISLMKEIRFPHSIGLLYSTVTAYLGFSVNNSEYKVMGLAPYGTMDLKKNDYYKKLRNVIDIKEDGSFKLDMNYFTFHYTDTMPSKKLCGLLGGPVTKRGSEMTQRHKDIAAAVQLIAEEAMSKILRHVYDITGYDNLVLAGGVALNSVCNGKILRNSPFKKVWIQPNPSDGGTSIGAASYIYHTIMGHPRNYQMENAYLGPEFSTQTIQSFLTSTNINYSQFKDREELINTVAQLIYEDTVVGWFQGRMEWGPRALGARSILANPSNPNAKELLNSKVKHREKFRPFAPVV